jgi:hypothetical protein
MKRFDAMFTFVLLVVCSSEGLAIDVVPEPAQALEGAMLSDTDATVEAEASLFIVTHLERIPGRRSRTTVNEKA